MRDGYRDHDRRVCPDVPLAIRGVKTMTDFQAIVFAVAFVFCVGLVCRAYVRARRMTVNYLSGRNVR